jgi:putative endonuclease
MYYFYVLYSLKDGRLYKGYSNDLGSRFRRHYSGGTASTKNRRPLVLIYAESYPEKGTAMARERWAKSLEGGAGLKALLLEKGILDQDHRLSLPKTT